MSPEVSDTSRVWLEELKVEDHLDMFFNLHSDPRCMAWSTKQCHASLDESVVLIQQSSPTVDEPWNRRYAIMIHPQKHGVSSIERFKPQMIGIIGTPRQGEIAYKLHPDYWGKGYMTESLLLFLSGFWADETNNDKLHINAYTDSENSASQNVLTKAGFKKGRLFEKHYILARNSETAKRSDLQCFFLNRPGTNLETNADWLLQSPDKPTISDEDAALIRNALQS